MCQQGERFKFAKEMLQKPLDFWQTVIWCDESKFELFSSKSRVIVWRTPKETFDLQCIVPTVKHDGDSVTVWGCFTHRGIRKLHILDQTMDRFSYRQILERNLLPSIENFGVSGGFTFVRDNDSKHTSVLVKDWLVKQHMKTLPWPSYSPELNPVETFIGRIGEKAKEISAKA